MINFTKKLSLSLSAVVLTLIFLAPQAQAANTGDVVDFYINRDFDTSGSSQASAVLVKNTSSIYFYVQKSWWDAQNSVKQNEILANLETTNWEFKNNIYPNLTGTFGNEAKPGIDRDEKITVLFHPMKENASGYFRSNDEYSKLQVPDSNEREMVYLSLDHIDDINLKMFLAHEFMHVITFNQKDRLQGVSEDVWLNEARADYTSTLLGYDSNYEGSNLQKRVKDFLNSPTDSLTEWQEKRSDYAVASMFTHYLVDHYGVVILADSLKSRSVGIASINEALKNNGFKDDFSQIFTNWTIATLVNDCSVDMHYCFKDKNLSSIKLNPTLIFLPLTGNSSLSSTNVTKNWAGNWQKIIGGNGDLRLSFASANGLNFRIPYLVYDKNNNYTVNFLTLDKNKKGVIDLRDFGGKYNSLVIVPTLQSKLAGFDGPEMSYSYTFAISITGKNASPAPPDSSGNPNLACGALNNNLYLGVSNQAEVRCLQSFLKAQGMSIYPEGLITGFFGTLTKNAVIKFQAKYQIPATGFVGPLTKAKINQLLNGR